MKFYGTLWEEQGEKITDTLLGADGHTVDLAEGTRQLNEEIAKMDVSPQPKLNKAMQDLWATLTPVLGVSKLLDLFTIIAEWVQKNPELTAGLVAFVFVLGILMGIFRVVSLIMTAVKFSDCLL